MPKNSPYWEQKAVIPSIDPLKGLAGPQQISASDTVSSKSGEMHRPFQAVGGLAFTYTKKSMVMEPSAFEISHGKKLW